MCLIIQDSPWQNLVAVAKVKSHCHQIPATGQGVASFKRHRATFTLTPYYLKSPLAPVTGPLSRFLSLIEEGEKTCPLLLLSYPPHHQHQHQHQSGHL